MAVKTEKTISSNQIPHIDDLPVLVDVFPLRPDHAALMIIDMQNFSTHPEYGWGPFLMKRYAPVADYYYPKLSEQVIPNLQRLITFFRQHHLMVIYFTVGPHLPNGSDYLCARKKAATTDQAPELPVLGSMAHEIFSSLRPETGDLVLNKVSRGAFTSTGIDLILRNLNIDTLIITGVLTNSCVESTARQAVDLGYKSVLVRDGTAAFDPSSHEASLRTFRVLFGQVMNTDQVINQLSERMAE